MTKRQEPDTPSQNANRSKSEIVVHVPDEPLPLTPVVARELLAILLELTEANRKDDEQQKG